MKKALYLTLSVLLVITSIAGILVWEFYIKDKVNKTEVFVANAALSPNSTIQAEDIRIELRETSSLPPNYITDLQEIIGNVAVFGLDKNDVISEKKINSFQDLQDDQNLYPVPNTWIESAPGSLRINDELDIFIYKQEQSQSQSDNATDREWTWSTDEPILRNIRVGWIRDGSNREITPLSGGDDSRSELSGYAYQLELIMEEEQFVVLKKAVEAKYKLLFSY